MLTTTDVVSMQLTMSIIITVVLKFLWVFLLIPFYAYKVAYW